MLKPLPPASRSALRHNRSWRLPSTTAMPPGKGKWPSSGRKAPRGRAPAAFGGENRDSMPTAPTMRFASHGFSMRDEARNTASHQSSIAWGSGDAKLRQRPVAFVSGGVADPLKEQDAPDDAPDAEMPDMAAEDIVEASGDTSVAEVLDRHITEVIDVVRTETTIELAERETTLVESVAEGRVADGADVPSAEEARGAEAKDLFFFDLGEDDAVLDTSLPPPHIPSPRSSFGGSDSSEEVILFKGRSGKVREISNESPHFSAPTTPPVKPVEPKPAVTATLSSQDFRGAARPAGRSQKQSKRRRGRTQAPKPTQDSDEDAILADYIANMAADSDDDPIASQMQSLSAFRDLGGDDEAVNFGSEDGKLPTGFESSDIEGPGVVASDTSDAGTDNLAPDRDDQEMDADMDDETLARLLGKQDELGLDGDDLVLFSESIGRIETRQTRGQRSTKASSSRALHGRTSAAQVADAFDNLDLADWDQLTGQSRKRRSKRPPNFNVSDSEIEAALQSAWQRDRERKKNKKLEREALRAEGLLGKNVNPDDLRVKYLSGMKLDDIKAELVSFLLGSMERLDFPPLDKHARMVLHGIANKFNIKSQSTGQGDQRRPVLYRTNRTIRYASTKVGDVTSHVDDAASRVHRKYFHRVDIKGQKTAVTRVPGGMRGGLKALTLREGEVVGASVPELGQDNRGRNMLEKMGWSKGMSLGASDNQGILEPVAQVMKRSKAGLG